MRTPEGSILVGQGPMPAAAESPEERFRRGYRAAGGPEELLEHILRRVLPCESGGGASGIDWTPGNPEYRTAAQFHPDTWARARRAPDAAFEDPFEVGWAVASWLLQLRATGSHPGSSGGWPVCWWR